MADTLEIFGVEYTNVTGIKATDDQSGTKVYIRPQGTKNITQNGSGIDVTEYASVDVSVPSGSPTLQTKTRTYTPSASQQTESVTADSGYDGLDAVNVTVNAAPSATLGYLNIVGTNQIEISIDANGEVVASYLGYPQVNPVTQSGWVSTSDVMNGQVALSGTYQLTKRTSSDLTVSGATVTAPAGYYSAAASKSVASMTLPTSAASSATSGYTSKATIGRSTAAQYINIPPGYNSAGAYYVISAVANGSATAPASISGTAASVSTGTNTLTLTKTVSVTPTVSAGYVSSGTASNSSVSLTASVTTKAAATITPGTTNQTIASGTYLTGTQTIAGDANLVAGNIISGKSIFGVAGSVVLQTVYTGSGTPSSSTGSNGDIYIQS